MKEKSRPTIGFLTMSIGKDSVCLDTWLGIVDAAQRYDANLICFVGGELRSHQGFQDQANLLYNLIGEENADGLIFWNSALSNFIGLTAFREYCERFRPLPTVDLLDVSEKPEESNEYRGMSALMLHLIETHGCRQIAFIRGPSGNPTAEKRYAAYPDMLKAHGIPFDPDLVMMPGYWSEASGGDAVSALLDQRRKRFDAVVAASDRLAIGAMEALQARGIMVPDEVAVAGFDNIVDSQVATPPLTTMPFPIHARGGRSVANVLAKIQGANPPQLAQLPMNLMIRRSCGCVAPEIQRAAAGSILLKAETLGSVLGTICANLIAEFADMTGEIMWFESLSQAFWREINGGSPGIFLSTVDRALMETMLAGKEVTAWHDVLSSLRRQTLPYLQTLAERLRAEDLWQQARFEVGEAMQRQQVQAHLRAEQQAQILREIGAKLITTFDVEQLMDILAEGLPRLGIPGCYLALYDAPELSIEYARLILAYNEHGRIRMEKQGQRFLSKQLVPEGILPTRRRYNLVAEPLYFQERQLGFVLFEVGPRDGKIYDMLREQVSSAIQGALLVEQVQQDARKLAEANQEIQMLNDQLKQENVRMGAELDVARRLQQMVLPMPEELEQIPGLDIVGYMQPAEEVGGDYYDILPCSPNSVCIGIGDVTGHGLESGVLMLMTQTAIRTLIDRGGTDPVIFLNTINRVLYQNIQRMGVDRSLTLAMVNYQNGCLRLIGQHEEALVVRCSGDVERMNTIDLGFPLGMVDDIRQWVSEATVSLKAGDGVVLYTDGITEAANEAEELYGLDRLCETLSRHWHLSAVEIKQAVVDDVMRHIGSHTVYDDLTLVVLKQR